MVKKQSEELTLSIFEPDKESTKKKTAMETNSKQKEHEERLQKVCQAGRSVAALGYEPSLRQPGCKWHATTKHCPHFPQYFCNDIL